MATRLSTLPSRPGVTLTLGLFLAWFVTDVTGQSLQSPADFLGYELGSRFSRHHQVVDYFEHVAANSDRVSLQQYGETYEGRPLMLAFVGTEDRVADLEAVRRGNMSRAGLDESASPGQVPIVWLSYNVHGNESVSTEASMATLYELVRPGGSSEWLENTLVVIDPCINPDGRDRYANWYNETVGFRPNADPAAREHREPWPGGRTNHYHFDLNRDWAWQTQQESQHRLALYNSWLPQVHVDFHEQGVDSPYYFAPAAEPYHDAITDWQRAFQDSVGTNHARYFDKNGWLYFTREVFDLFYPGYGDTYPTFNGGIGMTYEQGGSGRAGLAIRTAEGDTLTLGDRIEHHHTTGLSTVETTSRVADRVLDEFSRFYKDAVERPQGTYRTFIMKASSGSQRLATVASHLDKLGIEYGTVSTPSRRVNGRDYRTGASASAQAEAGDLVVNVRQPKGVLTRVLLEPDPRVPDSLTYDITAWALPYAYGLDAVATEADIQPTAPFEVEPSPSASGSQPYAYALRWDSPEDVAFLAAALQAGINARVNTEPFRTRGASFEAGTVLFTRAGNEPLGQAFHTRVTSLAGDHNIELTPLASGRVLEGSDFGSNRVRFVTAPKVMVATGSPVSSYSAGQIWHWFEQQLGYQVSMVNAEDLGGIDLDDYDVLVLPSGSYGRILTDSVLDDIRTWVRGGGRLVAIDGAARSLVGKDGFDIQRKEAADGDDDDEPADRLRDYGDRTRAGLTENVSGAVFRTRVDPSHPLGFGMGRGYYTLRRSSSGFEYLEDGWNVGVIEAGSRLSGKVGAEARDGVEESLAFGAQDMGRGVVIYLMDDPLFRAFWYEGRLLMGNAVFLSGR
ncbi:MAG: zinc carboxypeptidase [Rhodothermales bacterium]|nr:zinc carboxypeptidase [Rhodothermales bacterium]